MTEVVTVPVEPTEAMIEAYFQTCERHGFRAHINATAAWSAMLSAAPQPAALSQAGGEGLKEFPPETTGVQSRYVIVHQLRASADIQDDATKRETGWATTSDRAWLMRQAADAIERLAALSPEALAREGVTREQIMGVVRQYAAPAWCAVDHMADALVAIMSPDALATREEAPADNVTILVTKAQRDAALNSGKKLNDWIGGVLQRAVEEAPAEAGEKPLYDRRGGYLNDPEGLARMREGLLATDDWHDAAPINCNSLARLLDTIEALRAQPPAREDAQPVAYDARKLKKGDQVWIRATVVDPCTSCCAVSMKTVHKTIHPLIRPEDVSPTHPAPDALRGAVEALAQTLTAIDEPAPKPLPEQPSRAAEAMAGKADDEAHSRWEKRIYAAKNDLVFKVRQALAALQAEQGEK